MVEADAQEVDLEQIAKFTFSYMRRFAFGVLRMTPEGFGKMMLRDFLDAMGGYNEHRDESVKLFYNGIRAATYLAVVKKEDNLTPQEFWKLPWDEQPKPRVVSREEIDKQIEQATEFFNRFNYGDSNQ